MIRGLLVIVGFCLALGACTQRTICPAFQSAFIYDKEALRKKFSYFQEDSTPKVLTASKNQYLVAEAVPYRKKISSMSTIEMKDVNPQVPDSLGMDDDVSLEELDRAARSIIDSTYIVDVNRSQDTLATEEDSVYVITKDKEVRVLRFDSDSIKYNVEEVRYNIDQDNYMWYLRDRIVLPDVRLAQLQGSEKGKSGKDKREKKGIGGFFKNLFKKKDKKLDQAEVDTSGVEPIERSEFDLEYNESADSTQAQQVEEKPAKKKGLFSFLKGGKKKEKHPKVSNGDEAGEKPPKKKKEKKEKKPKTPPDEEAPEEESAPRDDGF